MRVTNDNSKEQALSNNAVGMLWK